MNHHGVLVKERSKYMIIFHPDEAEYHSKLDQVWQAYNQEFQQEAVLITSAQSISINAVATAAH
jgi:hypothetical protein